MKTVFTPYIIPTKHAEPSEGVKILRTRMDGWMTCDFTSFLTVFQSYQDDVWMIMKGCVQWNSVCGWEDFTSSEYRTRSSRSVGQRLTHWATGAPIGLGAFLEQTREVTMTWWWLRNLGTQMWHALSKQQYVGNLHHSLVWEMRTWTSIPWLPPTI